jgi:hypothetical protein
MYPQYGRRRFSRQGSSPDAAFKFGLEFWNGGGKGNVWGGYRVYLHRVD